MYMLYTGTSNIKFKYLREFEVKIQNGFRLRWVRLMKKKQGSTILYYCPFQLGFDLLNNST
jgi:hypothetical protein